MIRFPYIPLQASYSAEYADGVIATEVLGGPPRMRLDVLGGPSAVSASWVLRGEEYSAFMGYVRHWARSGGGPMAMSLLLDSCRVEDYPALFVPGSIRLVSKDGPVHTVAANLWVMPLEHYLDPGADGYASLAALAEIYGSEDELRLVLDLLRLMVRQDLPHD